MKLVKAIFLPLAGLWLLALSACQKEFTGSAAYTFRYNYQRYCGGELTITVPNSFRPGYNNKWSYWHIITTFTPYVKDPVWDSCERQIPREIWGNMYQTLEIRVFDKNNRLLYQANHKDFDFLNTGWDGRDRNNSAPLPAGQYYWTLKVLDTDDVWHEEQGSLHLLR